MYGRGEHRGSGVGEGSGEGGGGRDSVITELANPVAKGRVPWVRRARSLYGNQRGQCLEAGP